jgi:hypothetical protein
MILWGVLGTHKGPRCHQSRTSVNYMGKLPGGVTFFPAPYNSLGHTFEKNRPWVLAVALTTSPHPEREGM